MNWSNIIALTGGLVIYFIALLRVERRWRWAVVVLALFIGSLVWYWLNVSQQWVELWTSVGLALGIVTVWWRVRGRKLPSPVSTIKVWGQDAAPKPKPAELQAELNRLREDKAKLEAEIQKLKSGHNGHGNSSD